MGLLVILWKNYLIRKRHWILTLVEIFIPIVLFFLVSYARSKVPDFGKSYVNESTHVEGISAEDIYGRVNIHDLHILYSPKTDFTKNLIRQVQLKLSVYNEGIHGFSNEGELMSFYNKHGSNIVTAAVIFSDVGNEIPKKLGYDIRMYETHVFWRTDQLFTEFEEYVPGMGSETYKDKAFLPIQMALDTSFIELVAKTNHNLSLTFQEFPYPPYVKDSGIKSLFIHTLPILTLFSFLFLWPSILKRVIEEKCSGIKELMKLNGLKLWMLWTSWFINGFILNIISVIAIVLFLKLNLWQAIYPAVQYCDGFVLGLYLALFCSASITFCFVCSTFFNKPNVAMIIGILFWIITYLVFSNISDNIDVLTWCFKLPFLLLPNIALYYGYGAVSMFELREIHLNFTNLFESPTGSSNDITMGAILLMLLFDTVLFFMLTIYLDKIFPGPYGIAEEWFYPIKEMYSKFRRNSVMQSTNPKLTWNPVEKSEDCDLKPKIRIRDLRKVYNNKSAVNGLTLDIYDGQITGLLGHNGAGKTTTISILTGMISATSGRVLICDGENGEVDLQENYNKIRHLLSICPQHNLMFIDLTVLEHLKFFGKLRGLSSSVAEKQAILLLQDKLNLLHKKNKLVHTLSGGMKRKLALGMALMGNPEIIILDEPTSGIDIEGRRELWDLIQSYKQTKTIIITTHFMEEADVLANRIAIMDHGNLLCYGTSLDLKKQYDVGYYLTLNYIHDKNDESLNRKVTESIDTVSNYMLHNLGTKKTESYGTAFKFHLPNDKKSEFPELIKFLEREQQQLRNSSTNKEVLSFTLSNTTFEDVYLKAGKLAEKNISAKSSHESLNSHIENGNGSSLWQKFETLIKKRWTYMKKKLFLYTFMVIISFFIIALVLHLGGSGSVDTTKDGPTLNLDLNVYGETGVYYSVSGKNGGILDKYYNRLTRQQRAVPVKVDDVQESIIQKGTENIAYYKRRMVVGAEFKSTNGIEEISIMYSNNAVHGAAISLQLVMNTVLKAFAGEEYLISSSNTPLHSVNTKELRLKLSEATSVIMWLTLFPLAPLFVISYIISFTHAEEASNFRRLQHICGVPSWLYWVVNVVWDFTYYFVTMIFSFLLLYVLALFFSTMSLHPFGNYLLFGWLEFAILSLILLVYACSIPSAYWISYLSKTVESAYSCYLLISISLFPFMTVIVLVMEMSTVEYYEQLSINLRYAFAVFPQFTLTYMSTKFSQRFIQNHNWDVKTDAERKLLCSYEEYPCCHAESMQCVNDRSYFNDLSYLYVTVGGGCVLLLLLMYLDFFHFGLKKFVFSVASKNENNGTINKCSKDESNALLNVKDIKQNYMTSWWKFWNWKAVIKGISFQVKKGECFGLLGVNGAGKSTTFRILTKEEAQLKGEIQLDTIKYTGYCPQIDALVGELTGRELLEIFAALRGANVGQDTVNPLLEALDLLEYADQPCGTYSGGNKRKLSTCLSLIGLPDLIMLDEPTSGVDPASRRSVWNLLSNVKSKSALILSSHSMDECEALCDRLVIMKDGRIVQQGTIPELQRLKCGFTVKIKLTHDDKIVDEVDQRNEINANSEALPLTSTDNEIEDVVKYNNRYDKSQTKLISALMNKFDFELVDQYNGLIHGRIKETTWSQLFEYLEGLDVEDYSISETSLEDLFLHVAKNPDSVEDERKKSRRLSPIDIEMC